MICQNCHQTLTSGVAHYCAPRPCEKAYLCVGGPAHGKWASPHLPDGSMRWAEMAEGGQGSRPIIREHLYTQLTLEGRTFLCWTIASPAASKAPDPLPVVTPAAGKAFAKALGWELNESERFNEAMAAGFKVMLRENMERVGARFHSYYWDQSGMRAIYRALTGEDWPK